MTYTIFKGWHFSMPLLPRFYIKKNKFKWYAQLNNSCKYWIGEDQLDWNKLVGISNHLNPRKESIRFVWRYDKKKDVFEIGLYKELDEVFKSYSICTVKPNQIIELRLLFSKNFVKASVNNNSLTLPFLINNFVWRLNPYFGGNRTSPHNMTIKLK
jgi:hypothetical protein